MAVKLFVFDLDGTLFDTRQDIVNAVNYARTLLGFAALDFETVVSMVGNGVRVLAGRAFEGTGVPVDQAAEKIMEYYEPHSAETAELYPGVRATLPQLRGIRTVVSNKPAKLVESLLERSGIRDHFEYVAGGDTFARLKPDPMAVDFLTKTYRVSPREILVVGDHKPDIQMAKNAGVWSVYCKYGFFGNDTVGADFEIERFEELVGVVRRIDVKTKT